MIILKSSQICRPQKLGSVIQRYSFKFPAQAVYTVYFILCTTSTVCVKTYIQRIQAAMKVAFI